MARIALVDDEVTMVQMITEMLRADPQFADTPIVIVSAREDTRSRQQAFSLGANEFLNKPFNIDEFLSTIKRFTT